MAHSFDLLVIGGGINGVGIARDAAGRGLSVLLVEKDDLAGATSSASTKLIHGGLRYLEHYDFALVRKALIEREVLLRAAPHIIKPLRFVLPHHKDLRPQWLVRLGLFLYDHLGGRKQLPASYRVDLQRDFADNPLKDTFTVGFCYADCWVDDARLVVLNAVDAASLGAVVRTRTACTGLAREGALWHATLTTADAASTTVQAKAVVNASGAWVSQLLADAKGVKSAAAVRLVKGSHIVVRRQFDGEQCYIFQHGDGRIAFAIPYEQDFTLIGTTDLAFTGDANAVCISEAETDYLLELVNHYLRKPVTRDDIRWSYSGVRALYDDQTANVSAVTRDYTLELDGQPGEAPMVSVFGGKITTYRKLAEQVLGKLKPFFPHMAAPWTATAALPGGDIADANFAAFLAARRAQHPWVPLDLMIRWARAYGTRVDTIIGTASQLSDLGAAVAPNLYEAELEYLCAHEWAQTEQDVLWRRTKLGLHLDDDAKAAVAAWLKARG